MALIDRYPLLGGIDVAQFLGRPDDQRLIDMASMHVVQVSAMARSYTRGAGFDMKVDGETVSARPNDEIAAVIIMATARLVVNPAQVTSEEADGYRTSGSFQGFTLTERLVLDRYRRMAG